MIDNIKLIDLPKIEDLRGNLTFFEDNTLIPFAIERVFWTYDVPGGQVRGGHAYYEQDEFIVALSGSFDVLISDPEGKQQRFSLNRSYYGLYIPARTWRHLENFSTNAVALHASAMRYTESDYIRDFNVYRKLYA